MATGDTTDVTARLKRYLPRWFSDYASTPVVSALLAGFANVLAFAYSLYAYAALQTRINTATDGWLDLIAGDFFGDSLYRHSGQTDAQYRSQILAQLLRERVSRPGIAKILTDMTGRAPTVVEVLRPLDTGVYGGPYLGYGVAGAYGSQIVILSLFVTIYRPLSVGAAPYGYIPSDAELYAALASVRAAGYTIWARVSN